MLIEVTPEEMALLNTMRRMDDEQRKALVSSVGSPKALTTQAENNLRALEKARAFRQHLRETYGPDYRTDTQAILDEIRDEASDHPRRGE